MKSPKPEGHREMYFNLYVFSDYQIHVIFTPDIPASVRYLADRDNFFYPSGNLENCAACHVSPYGRSGGYLLYGPTANIGSYAHEAWHVVYQLFKWTGAEIEDEMVAYHL